MIRLRPIAKRLVESIWAHHISIGLKTSLALGASSLKQI
jgi:hypothetical protein